MKLDTRINRLLEFFHKNEIRDLLAVSSPNNYASSIRDDKQYYISYKLLIHNYKKLCFYFQTKQNNIIGQSNAYQQRRNYFYHCFLRFPVLLKIQCYSDVEYFKEILKDIKSSLLEFEKYVEQRREKNIICNVKQLSFVYDSNHEEFIACEKEEVSIISAIKLFCEYIEIYIEFRSQAFKEGKTIPKGENFEKLIKYNQVVYFENTIKNDPKPFSNQLVDLANGRNMDDYNEKQIRPYFPIYLNSNNTKNGKILSIRFSSDYFPLFRFISFSKFNFLVSDNSVIQNFNDDEFSFDSLNHCFVEANSIELNKNISKINIKELNLEDKNIYQNIKIPNPENFEEDLRNRLGKFSGLNYGFHDSISSFFDNFSIFNEKIKEKGFDVKIFNKSLSFGNHDNCYAIFMFLLYTYLNMVMVKNKNKSWIHEGDTVIVIKKDKYCNSLEVGDEGIVNKIYPMNDHENNSSFVVELVKDDNINSLYCIDYNCLKLKITKDGNDKNIKPTSLSQRDKKNEIERPRFARFEEARGIQVEEQPIWGEPEPEPLREERF